MAMLEKPVASGIFFQVDTVKGYRFWDVAGVLANTYVDRFQVVNYAQNTLFCSAPRDPEDAILELRASIANIWLSFRPTVSWVAVRQEAGRTIDYIARAISVTQFSRIGLRVAYLWGGESLEQIIDVEKSRVLRAHEHGWDALGNVGGGEYVVNVTTNRLAARVAFAPVQKQGGIGVISATEPNLPDHAILLDVDLVANRPGDAIDVNPHLNLAIKFLDDQLIPFVARLLIDEDS